MKAWAWLLCLAAWPCAAQEIAIYRCTAADGALTVQNQPCPKGMRQERKLMQTPAPAPLPVLAPVKPAAPAEPPSRPVHAEAAPVPTPSPVEKPAPPALYDCRRRDETRYLVEDPQAASYCVPLQVTGLDGNPQKGAGDACEVVTDTCTPVDDDALCAAWQQQLHDAESHWRFATPDHAGERQQAYARIRDLVAGSRCADGATASDAPQNP